MNRLLSFFHSILGKERYFTNAAAAHDGKRPVGKKHLPPHSSGDDADWIDNNSDNPREW
jgi:hypothetical protein